MTATLRCQLHHGDVSLCPPPELADVREFLHPTIPVRIVAAVVELDPCGSCSETSDWPAGDPVAVILHTAKDPFSDPTAEPVTLSETACAGCLVSAVSWHARCADTVAVEIPAAVGRQVAGAA